VKGSGVNGLVGAQRRGIHADQRRRQAEASEGSIWVRNCGPLDEKLDSSARFDSGCGYSEGLVNYHCVEQRVTHVSVSLICRRGART